MIRKMKGILSQIYEESRPANTGNLYYSDYGRLDLSHRSFETNLTIWQFYLPVTFIMNHRD